MIPVVDIFAGPGGLGEGFTLFEDSAGHKRFRLALSIEKDATAHATLRLRAFRRFFDERNPEAYDRLLRGDIDWAALKEAHPSEAALAEREAQLFTLGPTFDQVAHVRALIRGAVKPRDPWVLIGGPPCQAYSLVGRSRNSGRRDYVSDEDHRQTLYVEYLQILADHAPPIFVMENVKGLLSAQLRGLSMFDRILGDLRDPALAMKREARKHVGPGKKYHIHSLVVPSDASDPADYVVRAERYGIPQRRHRVILVGVRDDEDSRRWQPLHEMSGAASVKGSIGRLPDLRSGISKGRDSDEAWVRALSHVRGRAWLKTVDSDVRRRIRTTLDSLDVPTEGRGVEYSLSSSGRLVLNHTARSHIRKDLERYLFASAFAAEREKSPSLIDFPRGLWPRHKNVREAIDTGLFSDRFRVQIAGEPSATIMSHIAKDGHYYVHYDPAQCRSFTVREAATLQTFSPDYFFCGGRTSQYTQVGNAVPPALSTLVAGAIEPLL